MEINELTVDVTTMFRVAKTFKKENGVSFSQHELTPTDFTKLASICDIHNVRPHIKRSGTGLSITLSPFKKEASHG